MCLWSRVYGTYINILKKSSSTGEIRLDFNAEEIITTNNASPKLIQKFLNFINQTNDRDQLCLSSNVLFFSLNCFYNGEGRKKIWGGGKHVNEKNNMEYI